MDPEVRKLAKTRPWEGILLSLGLGILLGHSLLTRSIRFGNSRHRDPVVMRYEEQPTDFIIVMIIVGLVFAGAVAYTVFRFRVRARFRREDSERG